MARSRNIKPGTFSNELLAECHPLGRLLFIGLWCYADRDGRLEYRPKRLKAEILAYDDCEIDKLISELARRDFIILYQNSGRQFIQITTFSTHQNPHMKEAKSVIPSYCENGSTRLAPDWPHTSTKLALIKTGESPALTLNLLPDSQESYQGEGVVSNEEGAAWS